MPGEPTPIPKSPGRSFIRKDARNAIHIQMHGGKFAGAAFTSVLANVSSESLDESDCNLKTLTTGVLRVRNQMSKTSARAQAIAEILWQLKKADKLATLTSIAARAGFSPGSAGRTVSNCLKTVRRDWPHLQWWRAVADNGQLDDEQRSCLAKAGFGTETEGDGSVVIKSFSAQLMNWEEHQGALSSN
jgi:methylated-DNA-protein-cysteine methyltransferase related protein